jgi:predicted acyltransferase
VNRDRVHREARSPAALTGVAGTAVLGTRLTMLGWSWAGTTGIQDALEISSLVLWCLAIAWLPVLVAAELLQPRLGYDVRRWATVFPVAMYAVCSFAAGSAADVAAIIPLDEHQPGPDAARTRS